MSARKRTVTESRSILFRVFRLAGARGQVIATVKATSAEAAVARIADDREIADPFELARLYARPHE
jgi:hypothetical protein